MTSTQKYIEGTVAFLDREDGSGCIRLADGDEVDFDRNSMGEVSFDALCECMPVLFELGSDKGGGDKSVRNVHATKRALVMAQQKLPAAVSHFIEENHCVLYSCDFTADQSKAALLVQFEYGSFDICVYDCGDKTLENVFGEAESLPGIPATKAFWLEDNKRILIANDGHPEVLYFPIELDGDTATRGDTLASTPDFDERSKYVVALVTGC